MSDWVNIYWKSIEYYECYYLIKFSIWTIRFSIVKYQVIPLMNVSYQVIHHLYTINHLVAPIQFTKTDLRALTTMLISMKIHYKNRNFVCEKVVIS